MWIKRDAQGNIRERLRFAPADPAGYEKVEESHPDLVAYRLLQAKLNARIRINAAREAVIAAGVVYDGATYDSDAASVARVNGALTSALAGVALPPGFTWRDKHNIDRPMDRAGLAGLAAALLAHGYAAHLKARELKAQIEAAATVEEVQAVRWV